MFGRREVCGLHYGILISRRSEVSQIGVVNEVGGGAEPHVVGTGGEDVVHQNPLVAAYHLPQRRCLAGRPLWVAPPRLIGVRTSGMIADGMLHARVVAVVGHIVDMIFVAYLSNLVIVSVLYSIGRKGTKQCFP